MNIEILIVCGIKDENQYHDNIISIINRLQKNSEEITKEKCNFVTLQNYASFYQCDTESDLYISDPRDYCFIFNESHRDAIDEQQCEEYSVLKKFNDSHNQKFDYIILEHCGFKDAVPNVIKHFNLLKYDGYLIDYIHNCFSVCDANFRVHNREYPILLKIGYCLIENNIYQKKKNIIYDMKEQCTNYNIYCNNYNPNYNPNKTIKFEQKYFKYKQKYLKLY
jgi:hypothetical protein